jgi:serine/threonine protein kinase
MYTAEPLERELDQSVFPLERYKPIERLGDSQAFLCFDEFMEEEVVVKTLGTIELDQLIHFQREATLLCKMRAKSIAQVLDFGATACGAIYIVSEYQPGVTLYKYINGDQSAGPQSSSSHQSSQQLSTAMTLSPELAYRTFIPVAEALVQMHSAGVLHRDIRSSNILVRNLEAQDCAVYLIDVGTGRAKYATMQSTAFEGRTITGDPNYMAPEQVNSQQYDARSEIFAFGCAFFEALTGRTPFNGPEALSHLIRRTPPSLTQVSEGLSYNHKLETFVRKCLEKNADARFKSMLEVVYALKDLVKNKVSVEPVVEGSNRFGRPKGETDSKAQARRARRAQNARSANDSESESLPESEHDAVRSEVVAAGSDKVPEATDSEPVEADGASSNLKADGEKQEKHVEAEHSEPVSTEQTNVAASPDTVSNTSSQRASVQTPQRHGSRVKLVANQAPNSKQAQTPVKADENQAASAAIKTPGAVVVEISPWSFNEWIRECIANARAMIMWCTTTKQGMLSALLVVVLITCGWLTFSYMNYLLAPRVEQEGVIYAYSPATDSQEGLVELGVGSTNGYSELIPITIEHPSDNLPVTVGGDGWSHDLHESNIFENEKLDLGQMQSTAPAKPLDSDSRIGETWKFVCRKQSGRMFLENVKTGETSNIQRDLQDIHLTISRMFKSLYIADAEPEDISDWVSNEWAANDFFCDVDLNRPRGTAPVPDLFPSRDMKLVRFDNDCVIMLRAPNWSPTGYLTVTLRIQSDNTWHVTRLSNCSKRAWDRH